jgi:hypothetical protein
MMRGDRDERSPTIDEIDEFVDEGPLGLTDVVHEDRESSIRRTALHETSIAH